MASIQQRVFHLLVFFCSVIMYDDNERYPQKEGVDVNYAILPMNVRVE